MSNEEPRITDGIVTMAYVDELSLVDADVRKVFEGKNYFVGTPTQIQLMKEIRILSAEISLLRDSLNARKQ